MTSLVRLLLPLLLLPWPAWSMDVPLFVIQRSKNTNEVHYSLQVDERCRPASAQPVKAWWKLLEEGPEKTAALSIFDRRAYGIEGQRVRAGEVTFHLKALEQKRIVARTQLTPPRGPCTATAHAEIQGQWAVLERIYVQTKEGGLLPTVLYVDVFGKSGEARATPLQERLTP
ncbi:MAG: DUF4833 domain-containing protein [Candidatus Tectimicrobiota bacterium]